MIHISSIRMLCKASISKLVKYQQIDQGNRIKSRNGFKYQWKFSKYLIKVASEITELETGSHPKRD